MRPFRSKSFLARRAHVVLGTVMFALSACRAAPPTLSGAPAGAPPLPPAPWLGLIGEYGPDSAVRIVLERDGQLMVHDTASEAALVALNDTMFRVSRLGDLVTFTLGARGRAERMTLAALPLARRAVGPETGNQLTIVPVRPIPELRREALASTPPVERGPFLPSDLVELTSLDSTIHLEIRYATSNNLFGTPFYTQARAFLQRPAAEAVVRASAALRARGYGLLVHDGYRPWYVTKMFWDASPPEKHVFVADPASGSKHNRGAAVDLTLYDRATGAPVEMPSTYDETSPRAYPNYPGGTSRQRWHRDLLRRAMEAEGYTVYEAEWWHFDYKDWKRYAIGNVDFQRLR